MLSELDRYKDSLEVENLYDVIEMLIKFNNIKNSKEEVLIEEEKRYKKYFKQKKKTIFEDDLNIEMIAIKIYDDIFNGKLSKQKITPTGGALLAYCAKLSLYVNKIRQSENYHYTINDEFYIEKMKELMDLLLSQKSSDTSIDILNYAEKCLTEITNPPTETKEQMAAKKEMKEDFTEFIDTIVQETNQIFKPLFVSENVEKYLKDKYLVIEDSIQINQFEPNNKIKVNAKKNQTNLSSSPKHK